MTIISVFAPGDIAESAKFNYNWNDGLKLHNEKAINDVTATASGVLAGSSQKLIDKFLDANGQNNTVDTGSTTGLYGIIGKYYFDDFTISINASNQNAQATMTSTETTTASLGYIIVPNKSCFLISITKHASEDSNRAIVGEVGVGSLGTASFSGNTATFASPIKLIEGKTYYVNVDKTGSSRTSYKQTTGITYPYTNIYVNFTSSSVNGTAEGGNLARSIVSISTKDVVYTNSLIQSVATTIPTGMTKVFVTPLMYEALATGDSITADVSIDNGAHYTTGVPINTWSPITSANGTQLIVKMNLNTASGVSSPKILGWRVLME